MRNTKSTRSTSHPLSSPNSPPLIAPTQENSDMTPPAPHSRDLLHGITLESILNQLVQQHGWREMGRRIPVRCFELNPTVKSSLTFLRKTPWARQRVEAWFIAEFLKP